MSTPTRQIKKNGYNRGGFQGLRRKVHQQEDEARQMHYDSLSLNEKIQLVKSRGGSQRELARLEAQLPKTEPAPKAKKMTKAQIDKAKEYVKNVTV